VTADDPLLLLQALDAPKERANDGLANGLLVDPPLREAVERSRDRIEGLTYDLAVEELRISDVRSKVAAKR